MFQNRVHKTGCLSDLMIEHTTDFVLKQEERGKYGLEIFIL